MTVESYNGIYGSYMGDPTDVFAATAFSSTGSTAVTTTINDVEYTYYTNTPICWVGTTIEPGFSTENEADYFPRWSQGWSTIEAAWAGHDSHYFLAVTDVFLVK
jgi:hypothetical protein